MAVNSTPPVQLDPSQDQGHQIAFINQNFQSLANSLNPFILSDGSNNRLLIGKDSTGNYVVKVSKAGFDAFNAADANLIFNSGQDVFKVVSSGTLTIPSTSLTIGSARYAVGTPTNVTIAHGLPFTPIVLPFATFGAGYNLLPITAMGGVSAGAFAQYNFYVQADATNVYGVGTSFGFGAQTDTYPAIPVKYYLLQETAT